MSVPADFPRAFAGLEGLVARIAAGEVLVADLVRQVNVWGREDCAGSATLAKAALLAMRYELGKESLRDATDGVSPSVRTLDRVSRVMDPPERAEGAPAPAVRVRLPEALQRSWRGQKGS